MKIGRIYGCDIIVSNILLVLLFAYYVLGILPWAMMVFAIVLAHELGHIISAFLLNIPVQTVELFPFGGAAKIKGAGIYHVRREILLSLSGPFVNFVLAGGLGLCLKFEIGNMEYVHFLLKINLLMGFFNLLPILPLDGGRIFRAVLAQYKGFLHATRITASMGQLLSAGLAFWGLHELWQNWINFHWLLFAAFFFAWLKKRVNRHFFSLFST